jgi:drug/metabolite transporter (DMT)-like permease
MDVAAKILTTELPLAQVVWARFCFHVLWLTPAVWWTARRRDQRANIHFFRGHTLRGGMLFAATMCYFTAIRDNPIPDTIAVFFIEPIIVMFLAAAFLGEPLQLRRLLAAIVAFTGVLVILRPGSNVYSPTILFALLAALCFAGYIVCTRASSIKESPLIVAWGTGFTGLICSAPFCFIVWTSPSGHEWLLMFLLGALAAGGHLGITAACRFANASLVALFHYSEIIAATILSYLVFSYTPDRWLWVGSALIVGAKIIVTILEIREKRH